MRRPLYKKKHLSRLPNRQCMPLSKKRVLIYGLIGLSASTHLAAKSDLYFYRDVPYALCSQALCLKTSNKPHQATCMCPIIQTPRGKNQWRAQSISPVPVNQGLPEYSSSTGKLVSVLSTFSFANNDTFLPEKNNTLAPHIIQCTASDSVNDEYANCFGVRCDVKNDVAYCTCPVIKAQTYSLGFSQNKFAQFCHSGAIIWSGADIDDGKYQSQFLLQHYQLVNQENKAS